MRTHYRILLALAVSIGPAVSCTLITEVDRSLIDAGGGGGEDGDVPSSGGAEATGGTGAAGGEENVGGVGGENLGGNGGAS